MITLTREEAQQVLDALYSMNGTEFLCQAAHHPKKDMHKLGEVCPVAARYMAARETLRTRLAQPEPEPHGYLWFTRYMEQRFTHRKPEERERVGDVKPVYTAPQQRNWQGLTDEVLSVCDEYGLILARYWEAKLKEKNNG